MLLYSLELCCVAHCENLASLGFFTEEYADNIGSLYFYLLYVNAGGNSVTGAIAGGVAAGAALLFAAPAIAFAWWRRRKPQEYFFDVPGL